MRTNNVRIHNEDIIYPELSYQIVGAAYKIYNSLGFGLQEKYYQRAFAKELEKINLSFQKELKIDLIYDGSKIGEYYLDFLIDDKIIVEFKVAPRLRHIHIKQVFEYLKVTDKRLAILIFLTDQGVKSKRVVNPNHKD